MRRLAFGDEARFRRYIGGYFSVFTLPNYLGLQKRMRIYNTPGKVAAIYPVWQNEQARAGFLFRSATEFSYDYHDPVQQKGLIRQVFGDEGWEVPRLIEEMNHSPDFYLDSISQIRMDSWSKGRVTLVGDAGDCPGPAVGGGTTIAVVGGIRPGRRARRRGGRRPYRRVRQLRGRDAGVRPPQPHDRPNQHEDPDPEHPAPGVAGRAADAGHPTPTCGGAAQARSLQGWTVAGP